MQISLFPAPAADFTFLNNQCQFSPVDFSDISQAFGGTSVISWLWDFGDSTQTDTLQNPVHVYQLSGTYNVSLVVITNTGCSDSLVQTITIEPAPVAEFSTSSTCVGDMVSFTNTSSISGGGTINYEWNFGDNTTSNLINPTHQYAPLAGNYDVQLIALASNGCSDTLIQNIRIANKPSPQFTWSPLIVCKGNPVTFSNTSTGNGGDTIMVHLWDFGDNTQTTDVNPVHAYADTGLYQVSLTVVSPTDCDSSLTQQIYVIPAPVASFTAAAVCLNNPTSFNPSVVTPPGTVVDSIVWTFGDSSGFSGLTSPTHLYQAPGRYEVIMTVYNDLLCTGTFSDSVDVFPLPVAGFTTSLACSGSPVTFDGTVSSITNDTLSSWIWDFGGLGTGTDSVTQFNFPNPGSYNVIMVVSSVHGCTDTSQQNIEVIAAPDFDFVFNEPCLGLPAQFTFLPNVNPAPSSDLVWNFGDGSLSYLLNPSHVFATVDTFDVTLTVTEDSSGCSSTKIKPLVIHPLPSAGFIAPDVCQETQLTITDTSSVSSGSIVTWNWNMGVLGTSSDQHPVITPEDAGNYPVSLSVTTDQGCISSVTQSFTAFSKPEANMTADPIFGSPPLTVHFINNSTGGLTYLWDFGDNSSGSGASPVHVYSDTGNYSVSMIATSIEGCQDTAYANVSVLIPYMDVEVTEIFYSQTQDQIKLAARILNRGNVTVSSFQVLGRLDQYSTIAELWTGVLHPGNQVLYIFESGYLIQDGKDPGYYCVEVAYPNDGQDVKPENNSKCGSLASDFGIFSVYPNPFDEVISVNFNLDTEGQVEFEVYDAAGKLTAVSRLAYGSAGYNTQVIPTNQLSKGVYTVLIRFRDEVRRIQAVKLK
jgi:PKD repeat protein